MGEIIIITGKSGSGKTSLAAIFERIGYERLFNCGLDTILAANQCMEKGQNLVIDGVHENDKDFALLVELAHKHSYIVRIVYVYHSR